MRFSNRLLAITLAALVAAGAAVAPLRAYGKTPESDGQAPSAASQKPPATTPAQTPTPDPAAAQTALPAQASEKQTNSARPAPAQQGQLTDEERQNNLFRLEGPVVKWTAGATHLPVETVAILFEVLNFLIIALVVGIPLMRFLPRHLRNRKAKVAADIEAARKMTVDANTRLSAVEAQMAKLSDEIEKFRSEIEAEAKNDEAKIKTALAEESARIVESAEQEIAQAAAQARRGLRSFAADLAIDQAAKNLELTAETDRALIAEFVSDMTMHSAANGSASSGKGGKR